MAEQFDAMVLTKCQAKCAFCVQEATFKSGHASDAEFLAAFSKYFGWFFRHGGRRLVITGGEPLLMPSRVLGVVAETQRYPSLKVNALYTNGARLLEPAGPAATIAAALARAGLGCVNLSVHHHDDARNNAILGLPGKAATVTIASHLAEVGLPVRLNLTLQKGGVDSAASLREYAEWGFALGARDIYARELFDLQLTGVRPSLDRDPVGYTSLRRVSAAVILQEIVDSKDFAVEEHKSELLREKSEVCIRHLATGRCIYLSHLVIGTESTHGMPYLVLMPDAHLYRGWLGPEQRVSDEETHPSE